MMLKMIKNAEKILGDDNVFECFVSIIEAKVIENLNGVENYDVNKPNTLIEISGAVKALNDLKSEIEDFHNQHQA